jgi:hypothetical protein
MRTHTHSVSVVAQADIVPKVFDSSAMEMGLQELFRGREHYQGTGRDKRCS